jgi:hypothetical protein
MTPRPACVRQQNRTRAEEYSNFQTNALVNIAAADGSSQLKQASRHAHDQHVAVGQCCFEADWAERQYERSLNGYQTVTILLLDATQVDWERR